MISSWKLAAVILLCGTILVFIGLASKGDSSQERPISVSVETTPCKIGSTERTKIVLKSGVNGSDLPYGKVVLKVWQMDQMAASWLVRFEPIEGYTDYHGILISLWDPPYPGNYLVCARVSKSGCTCGQAVSRFIGSK